MTMPDMSEVARIREQAIATITKNLAAHSEELLAREIAIGLGQVEINGKEPDAMVQSVTLRSLRQQIMGAPTQKVEMQSQSLRVVATYDLPSEKIDSASQPDRTRIPAALEVKTLPKIEPVPIPPVSRDPGSWKRDEFENVADSDWPEGPEPTKNDTDMTKNGR